MKRRLVRSVSVLTAILALTMATMAAPASAGSLGGAIGFFKSVLIAPGLQPGDCFWAQDTTSQHYFVAFITGANTGQSGASFSVSGALTVLPDALNSDVGGRCQFEGTFV